eukprot:TRINITY_DN59777_c1_g1_i1.p5 TRINITY_DN59777_c1_g1~~TRINITY_DN59777_c1_g1_i1.p5  ORF type:complete len:100 (-),score=23.74 TRINITY_DN59777_c1_g1_i1:16-315(-)
MAPTHRTVLIAVATEIEAAALAGPLGFNEPPPPWVRCETGVGCDLVVTGVGKASAGGAVAAVLDPARHLGVLNVGIAGALNKKKKKKKKEMRKKQDERE